MENDREFVRLHQIGKGKWVDVVDLGRDKLDLAFILGQS